MVIARNFSAAAETSFLDHGLSNGVLGLPGIQSEASSASGRKTPKTIEERYQKKTPLEHILHRPESYIGSVQPDTQSVWVWDDAQQRMVFKPITYVPGLYKIFDEILVNAADVKARQKYERQSSTTQLMTYIKIDLDPETSTITIQNDGEGIPIEVHKEHGVYVPELIFGHLLTSDNYDDSEQRVTGGRNGYGAKLTNIFSTKFTIECADTVRKRKFRKTWKDNMTKSDSCKVTDYKDGKKDYVKVTFTPDLQRFQVDRFDDDFLALLTKRVYDVAGCCSVKVWLNGRKLPIDNFKSYVDLYLPNSPSRGDPNVESLTEGAAKPPIKIHEKSERWEVVISMSEGQFQQVSFVNAIATSKGGSHVNYVTDPLVQAVLKKVNTKNKGGMELKAHHVKAHLWVFVNALIVNPTFDSQSKETLTLKASQFGSKFTLSERTITAVVKSEIVESILLWAKTKQQVELQKKLKGTVGRGARDRISGIPKLEDANDAGTKYSEQCTLILTEGESAKTSCVAGLSVVGRDRYGVFPLRGKLLNVREASFKQQVENQEIQSILKIMGLQVGKKFETPKGLRYGSLMIMTDQDLDGSHIKGLLVNMIAHYWPQLLQYRGFLKEFVTPIVKVSRKNQHLAFFTLTEYEEWRQRNNNGKGWKIRYYKGLGTSTDREFKEYFSDLERHTLEFVYTGEEDLNAIDMAFNAKRAEDRKQWIQNYQDGVFVDHSQPTVSYSDFIHKELVQFSKYDVFRSIPNCIDGLKPVQRKVLFATFKRNLRSEIKVPQLTGYISECTAYHHGIQSLEATIIAMAQNFVGSNNINLLQPCGQFGSRKEGGKDASAVRYIFTRLAHATRALFPSADDDLLEYQNDDGTLIEPKFYVPVIPLVLVNGVEGIGTGWSSSVPNYNPRELIANVRRFIRGEPMQPMTPWYKGFKGRIEQKPGGFESVGIINKIDHETLEITELPVKVWTQNYKQFLEELLHDHSTPPLSEMEGTAAGSTRARGSRTGGSVSFSILDYRDNSSHEDIHFTIKLSALNMAKVEAEGLEKAFKLRKSIGTMNMTLFFDTQMKVQRYATELDIVREFGQLRLQYYELRRSYLIEKLERECRILKNKVRFIGAVVDGTLVISNRKKDDIINELKEKQFDTYSAIRRASALIWRLEQQRAKIESEMADPENEASEVSAEPSSQDYDYLVGMSLWTLSREKIEELQQQLAAKLAELDQFKQTTPEDLWDMDLDTLEKALDEQDIMDASSREQDQQFKALKGKSLRTKKGSRQLKRTAITQKPRRKKQDDESSSSDDEFFSSSERTDNDDDAPRRGTLLPRHSSRNISTAFSVFPKTAAVNTNARASTQKPIATSVSSAGADNWDRLRNLTSTEIANTQNHNIIEKQDNLASNNSLTNRVKRRMTAKKDDSVSAEYPSEVRSKTLEEVLGLVSNTTTSDAVWSSKTTTGVAEKPLVNPIPEVRRGKRAVKKKLRYDEDTEESSVMSSTSFAESSDADSSVRQRRRGPRVVSAAKISSGTKRNQVCKKDALSSGGKTDSTVNGVKPSLAQKNSTGAKTKRRLRLAHYSSSEDERQSETAADEFNIELQSSDGI